MKTLTRLSFSVVVIVAMLVVPSPGVRADEPPAPASSEMLDALDQIDSLLGMAGTSNTVSPDALSELSGLQAKFQRLQGDLLIRDKELEASAASLAEAAARLKALEDENRILNGEIENQHRRVEKAEAERIQAKADFERLFKDDAKAGDRDAESARQAAEIERLKGELAAALAASETLGKALGDEKSRQSAEIERLKGELVAVQAAGEQQGKALGDEKAGQSAEIERLKGELVAAQAAGEQQGKALGDEKAKQSADMERLKGELSAALAACEVLGKTLEDERSRKPAPAAGGESVRVGELEKSIEEMKDIDAQRKAAMDDLFKQLAAQKKDLDARDKMLAEKMAERDAEKARVADRDRDLAFRDETIATRQSELAARQQELATLETTLAEARRQAEATAATLAARETDLQGLRAELDQIKLVDAQRRKTLDETLTSLATSEQRATALGRELDEARAQHTASAEDTAAKSALLTARNALLEGEVIRMERDVKAAVADRDAIQAQAAELRNTLKASDANVVDLEAQVARLSAVDTQRRKAMDQVLLDTATLEQDKTRLTLEVQRLTDAAAQKSNVPDAQVSGLAEQMRNENSVLQARVAELEKALQSARETSAVVPAASTAGDGVAAVLAPVAKDGLQEDKQRLETQLGEQRGTAARDAERIETMTRELVQAQQNAMELTARIKELESRKADVRESDLFKELEQINSMLREKMLEVEADRQRLAKLAEDAASAESVQVKTIESHTARLAEMDKALTEAQVRETEYKELIERLVPQVEALEQQITALTQERQDLTNRLLQRDEDLQSLKVELERREHRLAKAERVADVLEKARTEVLRAGDNEKLNMHYNMASVYARDGKFAEAENEYLQALRIDPTDADVHYNLGILYDDEMKQPEKAMVHYRRYLQLNPHGPDADQIRNWLMRIEMKAQR